MKFAAWSCVLVLLFLGRPVVGQPDSPEWERPQIHFTPEKNWINDPNGLVYFDGEYHLFYQHNPFGDTWGHMSWGHAVSQDLLTWQHLPIAIPESDDLMAFSGSVVVDWHNSAGLQEGDNPVLVALYTGYRPSDGHQAQFLASSQDRGRTWVRFGDKPVLDIDSTDFRDPKVFRFHDEWRMLIALPAERKVAFYGSRDLKTWTELSTFGPAGAYGGAWECPDLWELPVENREGQSVWVLQVDLDRRGVAGGSGGQYFLGTFDGVRFLPASGTHRRSLPDIEPNLKLEWTVKGEGLSVEPYGISSSESGVGEAVSAPFLLEEPYFSFAVLGGRDAENLSFELWVDGEMVAQTTGFNGTVSDRLNWDVSEYLGKQAKVRLVDASSSLWGWLAVGSFAQTPEPSPSSVELGTWVDFGPDFYAGVSFSEAPNGPVWLAWMNDWLYAESTPTSPWRGSMSLPRTLGVRQLSTGQHLVQRPVPQFLEALGPATEWTWEKLTQADQETELFLPTSGLLELVWKRGESSELGLNLNGLHLQWQPNSAQILITRGPGQEFSHPEFSRQVRVPLLEQPERLSLQAVLDEGSVELFFQGGTAVATFLTFPTGENRDRLSLRVLDDRPSGSLEVSVRRFPESQSNDKRR